jgi:hypothetical protein
METDSTLLSESQKHCGRQGIVLDTYLSTLQHLVKLASTSGWKAHAWHRAKELETHPTGIWRNISKDLTDIMKAKNESISDK